MLVICLAVTNTDRGDGDMYDCSCVGVYLLQVLKGHDDHVITCLEFCGNKIVSGSDDNTLKVWSAVNGKVACLHYYFFTFFVIILSHKLLGPFYL